LQVDIFKKKVIYILNQEIRFDGHVDLIINNLDYKVTKLLLKWIENCKSGKERYESSKNIPPLLFFVFRHGGNLRAILLKEKNSYFLELFLDKHKYYDRKRKQLGI
jgi:hypothetical protein